MTGEEIAKLMSNGWLKAALSKNARRYSRFVENQEEYIQDGWLRISKHPSGRDLEYYAEQGRKAIKASYDRAWYADNVRKQKGVNPNGNSKKEDKIPRKGIELERGKYVNQEMEALDSWYYEPEIREFKDSKGKTYYKRFGGEWEDWVKIPGQKEWMKKEDAEHHGLEYEKVEKGDTKKWRINPIAVTKLSHVKNEQDWEEYEYRKTIATHEKLRHESGIGPGSYSLPDPQRVEGADIMEMYGEENKE